MFPSVISLIRRHNSHSAVDLRPILCSHCPHGKVSVTTCMRRRLRFQGTARFLSHLPNSSRLSPPRTRKSVVHVVVAGFPRSLRSKSSKHSFPYACPSLNFPLFPALRPALVACIHLWSRGYHTLRDQFLAACSYMSCVFDRPACFLNAFLTLSVHTDV